MSTTSSSPSRLLLLLFSSLLISSRFSLLCAIFGAAGSSATVSILPTDPLVQWRGRYRQTALSNCSFDWPGVQLRFAVAGGSAAGLVMAMPARSATRLSIFVDGRATGSVMVLGSGNYTVAAGLDRGTVYNVTVYHEAEPRFIYPSPFERGGAWYAPAPTVTQVWTDGSFVPPPLPQAIKLMVIGDSLSSGFGAAGVGPCKPSLATNAHSATFGAQLCAFFGAECTGTIAWAGKGLLVNSPSSLHGPPLPAYLWQTIGGDAMAPGDRDFDFNRPSRPDAILVNLGTNDCGVGGVACTGNASFMSALAQGYVDLAYNLTQRFFSGYPTLFFGVGPVTRAYEPAVLAALAAMRAQNITEAAFVNYTGAPLDGCDGHPGRAGHAFMFQAAAAVIEATMGWKGGDGQGGSSSNSSSSNRKNKEWRMPTSSSWSVSSSSTTASIITRRSPSTSSSQGSDLREHFLRRKTLPGLASPAATDSDALSFTVRADGSGDFRSVASALALCCNASAASGELRHVTLHLLGVFAERVIIPAGFLGGVDLVGDGAGPLDALIIGNASGAFPFWTFNTHTLLVQAANVTLINMAVANAAGGYAPEAGQSVALAVDPTADRLAVFRCAILGGTDTLYTGSTGYGLRSYFFDTYVNGTCDSIFGGSSTVIEQSWLDISYTVTAARGEPTAAYLVANSTVTTGSSTALLGRPWGAITTTVFKSCNLSAGVLPAGWSDWGHDCAHTDWCRQVLYAEFNSSGPGAAPASRPPWTRQLTPSEAAGWTAAAVLRGWTPPADLHPATRRQLLPHYYF